jgi:CRISPR-associated protein Cas2
MNVLVAYDVSTETSAGKRRLRKIANICLSYGQRVQKSVFECTVDDVQYAELTRKLSKGMNPREDSIRVYKLRDTTPKNVTHFGINVPVDYTEPLVF